MIYNIYIYSIYFFINITCDVLFYCYLFCLSLSYVELMKYYFFIKLTNRKSDKIHKNRNGTLLVVLLIVFLKSSFTSYDFSLLYFFFLFSRVRFRVSRE